MEPPSTIKIVAIHYIENDGDDVHLIGSPARFLRDHHRQGFLVCWTLRRPMMHWTYCSYWSD